MTKLTLNHWLHTHSGHKLNRSEGWGEQNGEKVILLAVHCQDCKEVYIYDKARIQEELLI